MNYTRLVGAKSLKRQQVLCSWIFFWPFQIRGINRYCRSLHLFALFEELFNCLSQGPDLFSEIHCFGGIHCKCWVQEDSLLIFILLINNAKWRLGVWETRLEELQLLVRAPRWWPLPMAGKSRQPSHEPPLGKGEIQATIKLKFSGK